jgi:hypothetical protein
MPPAESSQVLQRYGESKPNAAHGSFVKRFIFKGLGQRLLHGGSRDLSACDNGPLDPLSTTITS